MGRIKTTQIKRSGKKLIKLHKDKFSKDFEANKKAIAGVSEVHSKKLRNTLAGFVTRMIRKQQD